MVGEQNPLTPETKQAFANAILAHNDWRHHGGGERELRIGDSWQLHPTSEICKLVSTCANERLPDELVIVLARMPDHTRADLIQGSARIRRITAAPIAWAN